MSNKRESSLRGRIESAIEMTEKMISKEEYSASFTDLQPVDCPTDPKLANNWIKDHIRLYVETWVLPPMRKALAKVTKKAKA